MNYYEILKISKTATDEEIKNSYKQLVKKYHPDLYVGDKEFAEKKIKEINEAYTILSNPETKAEYDDYLNPKPEVSPYENSATVQNYNSTSENYDTSTYSQTSTTESNWSITHFLVQKFNLLDNKKQLQIFIIIFVSILALFLINLIQIQSYLRKQNLSSNDLDELNSVINNDDYYEDNLYEEEDDENEYDDEYDLNIDDEDEENDDEDYNNNYYSDDFQSFDDFLYELFDSYEKSYYNTRNTSPKKHFNN